jgi:hypothetical protein
LAFRYYGGTIEEMSNQISDVNQEPLVIGGFSQKTYRKTPRL